MDIFLWIYCMDMSDAAWLAVGATILFLFLKAKFRTCGWWKPALGAVTAVWLAAAIYLTVISRNISEDIQVLLVPLHSYRQLLNGGNREILRSNFMNCLLFYPGGLLTAALLPEGWPWWKKCLVTVLLLGLLSIGIEMTQYGFRLGRVEADDVLHNVLGSLLGCVPGVCRLSPKS